MYGCASQSLPFMSIVFKKQNCPFLHQRMTSESRETMVLLIKTCPLDITAKGEHFPSTIIPKQQCILNYSPCRASHNYQCHNRQQEGLTPWASIPNAAQLKAFFFPSFFFSHFCIDKALINHIYKAGASWISHSHIRSKMQAVPGLGCTSISSTPKKGLQSTDLDPAPTAQSTSSRGAATDF